MALKSYNLICTSMILDASIGTNMVVTILSATSKTHYFFKCLFFLVVTYDYIILLDQMKNPELNGKFGLRSCTSVGNAIGEFVAEAVVIPDRCESS